LNERVFKHQLDAKNRMRIPAKLRDNLGDGYTIMCGVGGCLSVISKVETDALLEKFKKVSRFNGKAQKIVRFFLSNMWEAEEDKQGRILIPEEIRKFAKLDKDLIILKNVNGIEIWSEQVWNDYMSDMDVNGLDGSLEELEGLLGDNEL
jgi:MraZ protein